MVCVQFAPTPYESYPEATNRSLVRPYQRRAPANTVLYNIVSENLAACLAQAQTRSQHGFGYPSFVQREFQRFLGCGILRHGFVRVQCADCPNEKLVAFSCKGRGFCPSCTARRMANTAAHLVDHVLPCVPYRQWVISFPKRVRFLLARNNLLLRHILNLCLKKIFAWQRRKARALGVRDAMCGAVTFCQRFGSLLNLNCHFHCLLPDGVFTRNGNQVRFVPIPPPSPKEMQRLVDQIARATEKQIVRCDQDLQQDDLAERQAHSIRSTSPSRSPHNNRNNHCRLAAFLYGYSLHAERTTCADDRHALERLCRYGARAPIANSRLSITNQGNALVRLKRPLADGRTHLTLTPIELLHKLAVLVPPPRKHLTRYHGVFAPAHHSRAAIVPKPSLQNTLAASSDQHKNTNRIDWAALLRRVFAMDILVCDQCSGPMKIIAVIPSSSVADKILDYLKLEISPPAIGPPEILH